MNDTLSSLGTIVLAICALLITGIVIRREFFSKPLTVEQEIRQVENWDELVAGGNLIGPRNAALKIIEFSDFQCPACRRAQAGLQRVRDMHPSQIAIVYRHFPLQTIHPYAFDAAVASECAGEQGKFKSYHDALFSNQDSIGVKSWERIADAVGVPDIGAFHVCVEEEKYRDRVESDISVGEAIGVRATPTFIVEGQMFSGALSFERWEERLRLPLSVE